MKEKLKKLGFTIAEVLIVIAIIGMIAEMTIPSLMQNVKKQEYSARLQKTYTIFNQVLIKIAADNGCIGDLACTGIFEGTDAQLYDKITPYFKIIKQCRDVACGVNNVATRYDNTTKIGTTNVTPSFILTDGTHIGIESASLFNDNCVDNLSTPGIQNAYSKTCALVTIDVNGPTKAPNAFGRDIFFFFITSGRGPQLAPLGGKDSIAATYWNDGTSPSCVDSNKDANTCAARLMEEGWTMKY